MSLVQFTSIECENCIIKPIPVCINPAHVVAVTVRPNARVAIHTVKETFYLDMEHTYDSVIAELSK